MFSTLRLSATDIEVLAWHFHDGMSLAQIGELLGVDRSSVRDRVNKCHRRLASAGVPQLKRPKRLKLRKRINLSAELMDALVQGQLPPLIRDGHAADPIQT